MAQVQAQVQHTAPQITTGEATESVAALRRRIFSPAEKLRIVQLANACATAGERGALLRLEGLYSSQLTKWRRLFDDGGAQAVKRVRRGPKPRDARDRVIEDLKKKVAHLEGRLGVAHKLLDLQKKVSSIFGLALPTEEVSS